MATVRQIIGRVGLVLKGDYDSSVTYSKLDVVAYGGKSYASRVDNNSSVPGTNGDWQLISERGAQGEPGTPGDKGDPSSADINLNGSVVSVTNNAGVITSIDLLATTVELVLISVTTEVSGVDLRGLQLNVYYNGATTPSSTVALDANGRAELRVPVNYQYRIAFPSIAGCQDIPDIVHTALVSQRSVEVEYIAESVNTERVRVKLLQRTVSGDSVLGGGNAVNITVGTETTTYYTDSSGIAEAYIPIGQEYTVSVPSRTGWVTPTSKTVTASKTDRGISMVYRYTESGLFIVDSAGNEYTLSAFTEAVENGTKVLDDAVAIKVSTNALVDAGGVFYIGIDGIALSSYVSLTRQWCSSNVLFTSIPENGNSGSAQYYYDGLGASREIQDEGDTRGLGTPAVDYALAQVLEIGGVPKQGFLPSAGQWSIAWSNRAAIDDIISYTRPQKVGRLSNFTSSKWTSTQTNAFNAWYWAAAANNGNKNYSYAVVPFFAY